MIRITKGDITLECETQADVKLALGVLTDVDEPPLPAVHLPVEVDVVSGGAGFAPEWRVGGPRPTVADAPSGRMRVSMGFEDTKPALQLIPSESDDSVRVHGDHVHIDNLDFPGPQHIPVPAKQLDVLEVLMLFPEGVQVKGVATLLGVSDKTVGGRMQKLKAAGLVELVPHSTRWCATQLARRAKLVRC